MQIKKTYAMNCAFLWLQIEGPGGHFASKSGEGAWLHKCFVATQLGIGKASWKSFKKQRASDIELDPQQQWVRLRP